MVIIASKATKDSMRSNSTLKVKGVVARSINSRDPGFDSRSKLT